MKYNCVLITGAAHGIGRQLAELLSTESKEMLLIDKENDGELAKLSESCRTRGAKVNYEVVDVTDRMILQSLIKRYFNELKCIDLVIANAGISPSLGQNWSFEESISLMNTNFFGVVNTFEAFSIPGKCTGEKPGVKKLVAVTSIAKLVSTHNSGFYSASKSALSKYLDSLRLLSSKSDVEVHEIVCGFVDTRVNLGLKHARLLTIADTRAAELILRGINKRKKRIHSIPRFRNFPWYFIQFLPARLKDYILNTLFNIIYPEKTDYPEGL